VTTQSGHREPVATNQLARQYAVDAQPGVGPVWAGDITYIPTRDGGIRRSATDPLFSTKRS